MLIVLQVTLFGHNQSVRTSPVSETSKHTTKLLQCNRFIFLLTDSVVKVAVWPVTAGKAHVELPMALFH